MKLIGIQCAFVALVLGASIWFAACQWDECREAGMSAFYCLKHIG